MERAETKLEQMQEANLINPAQQQEEEEEGQIMKLVKDDPWLMPYHPVIKRRYQRFCELKKDIEEKEGSLEKFASGFKDKFGLIRTEGGIIYREWAPNAKEIYLIGDFNHWNRGTHPLSRGDHGVWSIFLPNLSDGSPPIPHGSKLKASVGFVNESGQFVIEDRIPAWIKRVEEHFHDGQRIFDGVHWDPPQPYQWQNQSPPVPETLLIYESHVGMASNEPKVASYNEFRRDILKYIKDTGYTAIQLMAVMEHSYYPSFGYQVTNFFAVSSRFGTPDELKALVDEAHGLGLSVYLDLVHSHASINVGDGLNRWDGSEYQYFHAGGKGYHSGWGTRLFDYGNWEVLRFLLSNLKWLVDEYHFDGFRFDGVTSMLYIHHGNFQANWDYGSYFGGEVDEDAVRYLALANYMLHQLYPKCITIAEDVSGMAGLCRPVDEGGVGFDYRLGMGIPDMWAKICSDVKDEDWGMKSIAWDLCNRRWNEKTVAYCESHDQSLQGGKTIAFRLMDKEMYWHMSTLQPLQLIIDRGIALHKMIRLVTLGLGGEAYLAFMGNEFGHPEWVDFPRPGNNNSYEKCRRRWDLRDRTDLRYHHMYNFDKAMLSIAKRYPWMNTREYVILQHDGDKMLTFERGGLYFIFNFHPEKSFPDYRVGVTVPGKFLAELANELAGERRFERESAPSLMPPRLIANHNPYKIILNSDAPEFGGHDRIQASSEFFTEPKEWDNRPNSMLIYAPSRSAIVLVREEEASIAGHNK